MVLTDPEGGVGEGDFERYLSFFLRDNPNEDCPNGDCVASPLCYISFATVYLSCMSGHCTVIKWTILSWVESGNWTSEHHYSEWIVNKWTTYFWIEGGQVDASLYTYNEKCNFLRSINCFNFVHFDSSNLNIRRSLACTMILTILTLITQLTSASSLSTTLEIYQSNFLEDITLQFILDFQELHNHVNHFIFHTIISANPFSPLVLDHVQNLDVGQSRYNYANLINQSIPLNTAFSKFSPRFDRRILTFLLPPLDPGPELLKWNHLLHQVMVGMGLSNENPTYIFIHLDSRVAASIKLYWTDVSLTSRVVLFRNDAPLQILCIPCKNKIVQMPRFSTLQNISSTWRKYNGNLQNSVVASNPILLEAPFDLYYCVRYDFRNMIPFDICADEVIARKHNFSVYLYRKDVLRNGTIIFYKLPTSTPTFKNIANKNFNEKHIMSRSPERKVWYVHAIDYLPYIFLVIVPKIEMSFETLIMPFDSAMWLLTLLSVFGVILTTVYFSRIKTTLRENTWNKTFWTISTILGQTDGDWTAAEFLNCGGKALIFIGVWYAVIFLLGNLYQGELFSCMTAKLGPYVPPKLDQLLQDTDWDVVTMSEALLSIGGSASILTMALIPGLLEGTRDNQTRKFLNKLRERTKLMSGNKFQLASNISEKVGVTSTNGRMVGVNLPIIVLDREVETEIFVEAIKLFLDPIVVRNHAMTPFNSRVPWVGKRNFLYPLYSRGLGQLEQSGIYGQWKKLGILAGKMRQGYLFLEGNSKSIFLRKMLHVGGNDVRKFAVWEPLSYEAMRYSFAFCCVLLGLGVAFFAMECLIGLLNQYETVNIKVYLVTWGVIVMSRITFCFHGWARYFADLHNHSYYFIFHGILSANPSCPLILDNVPNWDVLQSRYNYENLLNQSVPLNTAFSKFSPRFDPRSCTFLLPPLDPGPEMLNWDRLLHRIMLGMGLSNENPTYIFIHASITSYWADASVTSSVVMFRNDYPLQILCIPWKKKVIAMPRLSSLQNVSSAWRKYNSNLQNRVVVALNIIGKQEPEDLDDCVSYNFRNIVPREVCADEVIAKKYNFSKYVYRKDMFPNFTMTREFYTLPVSTPTFKNLANKNFNEQVIMKRGPNRKVWYVHAIDYLPFIFLVITPKIEMSFETLIMPFDSETWVLTLLSVFGVILTTVYLSRMKTTLGTNIWDKTFWTISTILGQNDGDWTSAEFLNCGGKALAFIGVWYTVIFLLGNLYQGELFSCMTAKLGPYVPSKLDQLLQDTDWDVVTMSDVLLDNGVTASILTEGLIPDLSAGIRNTGRKEFLKTLRERTKYISGNKFQLASNISRKVGVTSINEAIIQVSLPIIVLDRVIQTDLFMEAIKSFLDPIVVRNHAMTPFNSRVPWVGKRNFLYPLYSWGLGQLEQSGIYGRWRKLGNLAEKRRQGDIFLKGRSRSIFLRKMLHVEGNDVRKFSGWE
ncbi:hypothetical protein Fcan01_10473 [Folsomia candida]|uniref:Uncharacterized protein n=1 Tax=Folsomia candida TaxID=158441 RepID=A0A226EEC6_FOLCA|nr:hypothetical protein Fcan01_10473 [Folsomia candida]